MKDELKTLFGQITRAWSDEELTEARISVYYSWKYPVRVGEISSIQIGDFALSELN